MSDLLIKKEFLNQVNMTHEELLIDLATYLYDKERLSFGRARKLAGLDVVAFGKELAKRDIFLKITEEHARHDIEMADKLAEWL